MFPSLSRICGNAVCLCRGAAAAARPLPCTAFSIAQPARFGPPRFARNIRWRLVRRESSRCRRLLTHASTSFTKLFTFVDVTADMARELSSALFMLYLYSGMHFRCLNGLVISQRRRMKQYVFFFQVGSDFVSSIPIGSDRKCDGLHVCRHARCVFS